MSESREIRPDDIAQPQDVVGRRTWPQAARGLATRVFSHMRRPPEVPMPSQHVEEKVDTSSRDKPLSECSVEDLKDLTQDQYSCFSLCPVAWMAIYS